MKVPRFLRNMFSLCRSCVFSSYLVVSLCFFALLLQQTSGQQLLESILNQGVTNRVYPGAVAIVGNLNGPLYQVAVGGYTYDAASPTPMQMDTHFDLASLTKVVSTTSAVALMYQNGYLDLETNVGSVLGEGFMNGGKEGITVLNCLLHNAGFAPDPSPMYWQTAFNCPNTAQPQPAEDFTCLNSLIYTSFLNETLVTPPGVAFKYSDLSFITLQMVVGTLVLDHKLISADIMKNCTSLPSGTVVKISTTSNVTAQQIVCAFEAYVRTKVFHSTPPSSQSKSQQQQQQQEQQQIQSHVQKQKEIQRQLQIQSSSQWMPNTGYLLAQQEWDSSAPTMNDTGPGSYTHKRIQGQVADGDCYAMGGIAGHAGVFSTAPDLANFAQFLLQQSVATAETEQVGFLNSTTVQLFTALHNGSQSSRALGWDTNTPVVSRKKCLSLLLAHSTIRIHLFAFGGGFDAGL